MPYSGSDDDSLPSNVQSLPAAARRQWVSVFNSTMANCLNPAKGGGAGSQKDCEATAFKFANGVVKKAAKEGRVLSTANMKSMMEAMKAMLEVMRKAGFDMPPDGSMGEKHLQGKHDQREHGGGGIIAAGVGLNKAAVRLEFAHTWLIDNGHKELAGRVKGVLDKIASKRAMEGVAV